MNEQQDKSLKYFITLFFVIATLWVGAVFTEYDSAKIATKLFNGALFLTIYTLYSKYWNGKNEDTDAKIYRTSSGTATYHGAIAIALALAIALG